MPLVSQEVQYRKKQAFGNARDDKFVSVMSDFLSVAAYNFSEVEEQVTEICDYAEGIAPDPGLVARVRALMDG